VAHPYRYVDWSGPHPHGFLADVGELIGDAAHALQAGVAELFPSVKPRPQGGVVSGRGEAAGPRPQRPRHKPPPPPPPSPPQAPPLAPAVVTRQARPSPKLLRLDLCRTLDRASGGLAAPRTESDAGHDDGQGEQLAEDHAPTLGTIQPGSRPERGGEARAEGEDDHQQVGSGDAERPGRKPPDLALAESAHPEV